MASQQFSIGFLFVLTTVAAVVFMLLGYLLVGIDGDMSKISLFIPATAMAPMGLMSVIGLILVIARWVKRK